MYNFLLLHMGRGFLKTRHTIRTHASGEAPAPGRERSTTYGVATKNGPNYDYERNLCDTPQAHARSRSLV